MNFPGIFLTDLCRWQATERQLYGKACRTDSIFESNIIRWIFNFLAALAESKAFDFFT